MHVYLVSKHRTLSIEYKPLKVEADKNNNIVINIIMYKTFKVTNTQHVRYINSLITMIQQGKEFNEFRDK